MVKALTGMVGFAPVVENTYDNRGLPSLLDGLPEIKIKSGLFKKIPLLTGVTKHETANAFVLNNIRDKFSSASEFLKTISSSLNLEKLFPMSKDLPKITILGTGTLKILHLMTRFKEKYYRECFKASRFFTNS